jgi:type I restriction-modification system DNA methylase subunit
MEIFGAFVNNITVEQIRLCCKSDLHFCNSELQKMTGIIDFFEHQTDFESFKTVAENKLGIVSESDRSEYGDFQTNRQLAKKVCVLLKARQIEPKVIIEPTCGKGAFIIAALETFPKVEKMIGIEIFKPYVWQTKFSILEHFLNHKTDFKPIIILHHKNIFDFNFDSLNINEDVLVLGNPPWVTNATLSTLESNNLPTKSNFKQHTGLDALTGKGNFDIGESILSN